MALPPNPNAFANSPLDRQSHRRADESWLATARASAEARYGVLNAQRFLVHGEGAAIGALWLAHEDLALFGLAAAQALFLGVDAKGAPRFALDAPDAAPFDNVGRFEDARAAAARLARDDLAMLGCAKAIFDWHARHGFCAKCGAPSLALDTGWKRVCPACGAEHFPRVDPVVIMAPVYGEACLLGRQKSWPRGMVSALAGFVEPGETIEEAVARETFEEAGLVVSRVRLHSSQPWPFPSSLMIGAICEVESDVLTIDESEIESARWFSRDEIRALLAGALDGHFCPLPFAIAHQIIKTWADE